MVVNPQKKRSPSPLLRIPGATRDEPPGPACARSAAAAGGGAGARCVQSDEDKIGGNRRISVHDRRGLAETAGT
jgi:hypothetical protein